MKSLSKRLMLGAVLGAVTITGSCGALLDFLVRRDLVAQFDANLLAQAHTLGALVEFDEDGYQFEWDGEKQDLPQWFLIRQQDGNVIAGSKAMHRADLPELPATDESVLALDLPTGEPARAVALRFMPRIDPDHTEPPKSVILLLAEPTTTLDATLVRTRLLILLSAAGALFFSLVAIRLIVPGALRPLRDMAGQIEGLKPDALRPIDPANAPRELVPVIEQLNGLLARMDDALRREREFAAGAAHELRTPLAGIRAKLELALSRDRQPDEHRKLEQSALDIAVAMQGITQNLLLLARPESSDTPRTPEQMDLHNLLRDQWQHFAAAAASKNATIDWDLRAEGLVHADRQALQIVISNQLENAAEYVNAGGSIHVQTSNEPGLAVLRITNSGCHLKPEQARRVFEPFWRGDESRTERAHAGLGLAICRRVASAIGGQIEVVVSAGSFTVALKLPANV